ncbi:FMR1-interacting protein NUFIP1 [Stigmatopora argus]
MSSEEDSGKISTCAADDGLCSYLNPFLSNRDSVSIMDIPGSYPSPNFDYPPTNSIQLSWPQTSASRSNFQPSMWNWGQTEASFDHRWAYSGHANVTHRPATGPVSQPSGPECYQPRQQWWRNSGPAGNHEKKNKKRKEPDFSHFCDTCDRGFKDLEKYEEHLAQHVKCSVRECNFTAHEKIVAFHWRNTHAPGRKRIKLDTAEEIAKWREERQKNFPTLQNVEKKRKLMEEREKTGAVLETAQFGRMRGRGRGRWRGRGRRSFQNQHGPPQSNTCVVNESPPPLAQPSQNGDPLGVLAKSDNESDGADSEPRTTGLAVAPKQMTSALGSLLANYNSMSESENDEDVQGTPIQTVKVVLEENKVLLEKNNESLRNSKTSQQDAQASKLPGPWSGLNTSNSQIGRGGWRGRGRGRGRHRHNAILQTRRATLLEMLLAPDIRHERNVLLQCVRYVVCNNFFGLGSKPQLQNRVGLKQASSEEAVKKESRTLSDSTVDERGCSIKSETESNRTTTSPTIHIEENMEKSPADMLSKNAFENHLTKNRPEGTHDRDEAGSPCQRARCGSPGHQVGFQDVETLLPNDQKSKNAQLASAQQVAEEREEIVTSDQNNHGSTTLNESTLTINYNDDEIWEMPS